MTLLYDQSGNRKYLNPAERFAFYETVEKLESLPHKSLCMVLLYTGCRISEALNLRFENLDQSEKNLVFKTLKQRGEERTRALPVPIEVVELLLEQKAGNSGNRIWDFSRWTGWRIVKKYMAEAGLSGVKATPKGLRHAFAIDNLTEEVPLTAISKWLGHSSIDTTKIYLDFIGPDERALASRAWPHRNSGRFDKSVSPATVTEIETFKCSSSSSELARELNRRIKEREERGWSVSQIEHIKDGGDQGNKVDALTAVIMVVFMRKAHPTPS